MREQLLPSRFGEIFDILVDDIEADEPSLLEFKYQDNVIELLNRHIRNRSNICLLADVDLDGLGSAYIVYEFLNSLGLSGCIKPLINKERVHGLSDKHIDYINNKSKPDLFIIVDSSSSDLDIIRQFNCDVIVFDHHKIDFGRVGLENKDSDILNNGNTSNGVYYIISNILSGLSPDMSGCQVCYEFFRIMEDKLKISNSILKSKLLYQIVGVTLFSDAIKLCNFRNQWYIQNTLCNFNINSTLKVLMSKINKYNKVLTKTFIQFKLVPLFNKVIRAGYSSLALNIFLNFPDKIDELINLNLDSVQKEVLNANANNCSLYGNITVSNLGMTNTSTNYSGLIAQRLVDTFKKSSIAFKLKGDIYKGSFRGLYNLDYNKALCDAGIKCAGHKSAFGIEFSVDSFPIIQSVVDKLESNLGDEYKTSFISVDCSGGEIELSKEEFNDFKSSRGLWDIAHVNKNLASSEQLLIKIHSSLLETVDNTSNSKFKEYKLFGIRSVSFDSELTDYVNIYCEYTDSINVFIRNIYE